MYSPTKLYLDHDRIHPTSKSHNTGSVSSQDHLDRETSRVYQSCGYQMNSHADAIRDQSFSYQGNQEKLDSIYNAEPSTGGYYYDTHASEPGLYSHHRNKSSIYSHVNEDMQGRFNHFMKQSNLKMSAEIDFPGAIESESSSFDNSFDCSDSAVSQNSKCYNDYAVARSSRNFAPYRNDYNEGYGDFTAYRYDQKCASSKRLTGATAVSHTTSRMIGINSSGAVKCKMIEVLPGEFMQLRGAHETWKAIQDDFYLPCACFCCELTLFCIQDATYVLCPECQVVNPLEKIDGYGGGVGLGFTMEELAAWQNDIVMNRRF